MDPQQNTIIESLGIYLPSQSMSTSEVLNSCQNQIRFPLEKISGIKSRRVAGQEEFSLDLAINAVTECFKNSKYHPADIDLLICCNISKIDSKDRFSFEPSTAIKLRRHFGFNHAIAFDITNACAGMFTGIFLGNTLIKNGAIRRAMVVSGEYITHLMNTAQREIENFMDSRLACLTLGDAGAAVILEKGENNQTGFHSIDIQTFGRYSPYCIAKVSEKGGWIMYTDSVNLTDVGIKSGAEFSWNTLQRAGWALDKFHHLLLHQTSRMTLNNARNEINSLVKNPILNDSNTIDNLEERGNTASTSHFVAIFDQIQNNRIQPGDKVVFGISASGLTTGTALYVFDDLPDRLRKQDTGKKTRTTESEPIALTCPTLPGIRIESIGTSLLKDNKTEDSMVLLYGAATNCFEKSQYHCRDIELLIHCGVYRSEFVLEPAYSTLLAGRLNMNATYSDPEIRKTFAFDIFNGSLGFLNACYVAQQMIASGNFETAMVVASEIENNAKLHPDQLLGLKEASSAVIFDRHPDKGKGMSTILFNYSTESIQDYSINCTTLEKGPFLHVEKSPDLEQKYLEAVFPLILEILHKEGLLLSQINWVFPPQISPEFIDLLADQLNLPREKFIDLTEGAKDLFTSSIPFAIDYALEKSLVNPGDIALMISVGSGIQAGCAIYHF
ncbi:3-oxoacyl-[acyl-carrier-protein] synthase III C-terminal domain-containing protein [Algoriphagus sp. AK58]|uniref:3-oxoacyl-[acyl-carrier-protein] synthase III C-terminal domain-containing protein n=1 Tax=Algoriphagus sp. AK58 TaxID=1406877 RepID=UPI001650471D|nr:3-oxoacyl-[acyl-carrier-protein] synthase III C-terminal domain-containing protein [Algoriphagus sp. AK58]MBC6366462.1 3-oxoacyl-ACP synthase [Algoriphagus sp. AK58]